MSSPTSADAVAALAPSSGELAELASSWRSAYVHIPFCLRRCPYCDFSIVDESMRGRDLVDRYVDAVVAEIGMADDFGPLDAINFGGGTPTRVPPGHLGRIVTRLADRFGLVPGAEISLEANPEDWTPDIADRLVEYGFNRVSLGTQSFDDDVLRALGRVHSTAEGEQAVETARAAGFGSVSVDLIFGHVAESDSSWQRTVERALDLEPDHISTYSLTVEPGTVLAADIAAGAEAPDDDEQADRYWWFLERGAARGIERYEVSNHARHGHACRYNLATWANADYLGFGMAAHDHVGGTRTRNYRVIGRYLAAVEAGQRPRAGSETLTPHDEDRDALMLGLRLAAGVPLDGLAQRFAASPEARALTAAGVITTAGGRLVVTDPMRSDAVIREALSVSAGDC